MSVSELDDSARLLGVDTVAKLNDLVAGGARHVKRHVEFAEALLTRRVSSLADRILQNRPRLILVTSHAWGGYDVIAHALELQLRLRELRGVAIDVATWAKPGGGLRLAEMRSDLAKLYTAGHVRVQSALPGRDGGYPHSEAFDLPAGGYVMLYGEGLLEAGLGGHAAEPLSDCPPPHFRVQALPLCCVSLDEFACVGGHSLLLLRALARALSRDDPVVGALRAFIRRHPADHFGHASLAAVAGGDASHGEWRQINFSFAYELPLYASLLRPALAAVTATDDIYPEARRLLDMLEPFVPLPTTFVPSHSPTRSFFGGAWL